MRSFETNEHLLIEDTRIAQPTLSYAYGAAHVCARYCGFESPPYPPIGQMQHGWIRPEVLVDPQLVIWDDGRAEKEEYHWVNRKSVQDYLRLHGFAHAHATGVGYLYQEPIHVPRLKNSLLVMPGHSLYTTEHDWDFQNYLQEILAVKKDFDTVTVCVHPACMEKGYWVDAFQRAGLETISGAMFAGKNALHRMLWMMSRFEYVTTNLVGTNLAYAAYAGAKVSLYGKFLKVKKSELLNVELFQKQPHVVDLILYLNSEESIRKHYDFLFCEHPKAAKSLEEWGAHNLGIDDKRSPAELCDLFCWPRKKHHPVSQPLAIAEAPVRCSGNGSAEAKLTLDSLGNKSKTLVALRTLALDSNAHAAYELGLIFRLALHHQYEDQQEAFLWFHIAAQNGHPDAQFIVATCLILGEGITADSASAHHWLTIAAANGVKEAEQLIAHLAKSSST